MHTITCLAFYVKHCLAHKKCGLTSSVSIRVLHFLLSLAFLLYCTASNNLSVQKQRGGPDTWYTGCPTCLRSLERIAARRHSLRHSLRHSSL